MRRAGGARPAAAAGCGITQPPKVEEHPALRFVAPLFELLMADEEGHIDFLETQLDLIDCIGLERYTQAHIDGLGGGTPGLR